LVDIGCSSNSPPLVITSFYNAISSGHIGNMEGSLTTNINILSSPTPVFTDVLFPCFFFFFFFFCFGGHSLRLFTLLYDYSLASDLEDLSGNGSRANSRNVY